MANFEVYSYPDTGSYFMALVPLILIAAMWLSRKAHIREKTVQEKPEI
jgi:hypothetical protein